MKISGRARKAVLCPYVAKSAYYHARIERGSDNTPGYDSLYELGTEREAELGKGRYSYTLQDEESKINVNTSPQEILSRLPGMDVNLAASIKKSKKQPFRAKEELLLIDGITEEIFQQFKDLVTVEGKGWVNINTASKEVLEALGMDDDLIRTIREYRGDSEGNEVREDSPIFDNTNTIVSNLRSVRGLFQEQEELLLQLIGQGLLQISGSAFSLSVKTEILNKPAVNYTIVMVDGKIKNWSEK